MSWTIVEVEWLDSRAFAGWAHPEEHLERSRPSRCRSVGYLLLKDRERIVLAQSCSDDSGNVADPLAIPRGMVKAIRVIGKAQP